MAAETIGVARGSGEGHAIASIFGNELIAKRAFAAGEIVLDEAARFLLVDGACPAEPALQQEVAAALKLPLEADMVQTLAGALALWVPLDAAEREQLLGVFNTPDGDGGMASFLSEMVATVQAKWEPLGTCDRQELTSVLCAWLLSAHTTSCDMTGECGSGLFRGRRSDSRLR